MRTLLIREVPAVARPIKSTRHRGEREYHAGMPRREVPQPPHFRSSTALTEHIASRRWDHQLREWKEEWAQRWVVYADLVAFASRALRSESVVLNNIVRFDRASTLVAAEFPEIAVRRFSDATFAVAGSFHQAMAFGIALSHTCLAFNREFLNRGTKPFFIHLIAPRITIANGQVLLLPTDASHPRFDGIDPRTFWQAQQLCGPTSWNGIPPAAFSPLTRTGLTPSRSRDSR